MTIYQVMKGSSCRCSLFIAHLPSFHLLGVILYGTQDEANTGDFLSLSLVNGYLQFRYDLGSGIANIT